MRRIDGRPTDEVTYFFLIKDTDRGGMMTAPERDDEINGINNMVREQGGQCSLFSTRGSLCDFVSIITGISAAAAIKIAGEIEKRGTVKATLISGLEIFNRS
jgi:uncharacterized protein with GYD domain